MLLTQSEQHEQSFKTPVKRIQRNPETKTVQQAPCKNMEPKLEQMARLITSLEMDDSCENAEQELVQNDTLWMKEMMSV
jgi:hypothetical protein